MRVTRNYKNGITVEIDRPTMIEVFEALAEADEVFSDLECEAVIEGKKLSSDKVKFVLRLSSDNRRYYELVCFDDGPLQNFKKYHGQYDEPRKGQLFAKSKPRDGDLAGLRGWCKYVKDGEHPTNSIDF